MTPRERAQVRSRAVNAASKPLVRGMSIPAGFREITITAFTDGRRVVIPEQTLLKLPDDAAADDDEGYHDCDANGCGWEHVLVRFMLPRAAGGES